MKDLKQKQILHKLVNFKTYHEKGDSSGVSHLSYRSSPDKTFGDTKNLIHIGDGLDLSPDEFFEVISSFKNKSSIPVSSSTLGKYDEEKNDIDEGPVQFFVENEDKISRWLLKYFKSKEWDVIDVPVKGEF